MVSNIRREIIQEILRGSDMLKIQKAKLADFRRVSELATQLYNAQVPLSYKW